MMFTAAVVTVSDSCCRGEREDRSGPAIAEMLAGDGWEIVRRGIVPDERTEIEDILKSCADESGVCLIVTTGGTGFAARDITPEATRAVIERETPGIPEAMRAESMRITPRGCLSREAAGIRGMTLIVNCPGSEKAVRECLGAVLPALRHGVEILRGTASNCAASAEAAYARGRILAVCISESRGTRKHAVESAELVPNHGISGDAHAGDWHRQVSMLAQESALKMQGGIQNRFTPGDFAENILTEGIELRMLPTGTRIRLGADAEAEVTQIGKECHADCEIRRQTGDCVMPREGIFVKILKGGVIRAGDKITALPPIRRGDCHT